MVIKSGLLSSHFSLDEKRYKILQEKIEFSEVFKNKQDTLLDNLIEFLEYAKSLKFGQLPDYDYWEKLLQNSREAYEVKP